MKRAALILVALTAGCHRDAEPVFANLSVTLPEDTGTFPDRPGKDAMVANCGACHSPSMIVNQPRLTTEQWKSTIRKMREVYKAPIDPAAEPAILRYLEETSATVG